MYDLLPDFPPGPLDLYRKKATFDWKKLKIFLDTEDIIKYQNDIYEALQAEPEYNIDSTSYRSFDETRRVAARQALAYKQIHLLSSNTTLGNLLRPCAASRIMMSFFPASTVKFGVCHRLFRTAVIGMGTKRHLHFLDDLHKEKISGCYCLTEIGHGSNARGMRTTATYDANTKNFYLNTPDFEAAKCWAGGLGQVATHAVVYAQLIIKDKSYGLHAFVVPIRNPETLLPYPGLEIGDMGEKVGLNGIDNGFMVFNNYPIPRENLLNKIGDVTEDGKYITPFKDPNKRHGAALGSLSAGRTGITIICETMGIKALAIAIRYAAVRRQFGPDGEDEIPILEYQTHQHRLFPYLAAAYVIRIFATYFTEVFNQFMLDTINQNNKDELPDLGMEIHAISSACKPMAGWIMKDAIQECREACGGHGYLKVAGIGDIRNDHDANLTYEGENHVLIQQNSNWLLKMWPLILNGKKITTPLKSADFLSNGLDILANGKLTATSVEEMCIPENIISIYQWLTCYLLQISYNKVQTELKSGKSNFEAKNDSNVYYARNMSVAFIQHFFLQRMLAKISEAEDPAIANVLTKLFSLYGLWSLEKHIPTLYQGEFAQGSKLSTLVQDSILKLCADLKNDAVSLIDAVAQPDFILKSVLGASDGMVYKRLQSAMYGSHYAMKRPAWWQEIVNGKNNKSKL